MNRSRNDHEQWIDFYEAFSSQQNHTNKQDDDEDDDKNEPEEDGSSSSFLFLIARNKKVTVKATSLFPNSKRRDDTVKSEHWRDFHDRYHSKEFIPKKERTRTKRRGKKTNSCMKRMLCCSFNCFGTMLLFCCFNKTTKSNKTNKNMMDHHETADQRTRTAPAAYYKNPLVLRRKKKKKKMKICNLWQDDVVICSAYACPFS